MSRPDKICNSAGSFVDLHVDCAHGVGGIALSKLNAALGSGDSPHKLRLHLYNLETDKPELLNLECGADFVKISSQAPTIHFVHSNVPRSATDRWATIDGDADRLLYFYHDYSAECPRRIVLLDGDRIACLFASFFTQLLNFTRSEHQLTVGVIQTAYANTGSTAYLRNTLSVSVKCVPTGVKHLHHAARDFDIGIYFEANGHGTVLYSTAALNYIRTLDAEHPLAIFYALTNTAVGDAITDILLVEYALAWHTWSLFDWAALYTESASRQVKVGVKDPSLIQTTDAERRVSSPAALQDAIDGLVALVDQSTKSPGSSRAFVRPSGTEPIVRVYAESSSQLWADWLALKVALATYDLAGGSGPSPDDPGPMPDHKE